MSRFALLIFLSFSADVFADLAVLPPRLMGQYQHLFANPENAEEGLAELIHYYAVTRKSVSTISPAVVSNYYRQRGRGFFQTLNSSKLNLVCRDLGAEVLVLSDATINRRRIALKGLQYYCAGGTAGPPSEYSSPTNAILPAYYEFSRRLFRGEPDAPTQPQRSENTDVYIVFDTSLRMAADVGLLKKEIHSIFNLNPGSQLGFIALAPSGRHLFLSPRSHQSGIDRFFNTVTSSGQFKEDYPLSRAFEKIDQLSIPAGSKVVVLTNQHPQSQQSQNYVMGWLNRLLSREISVHILGCRTISAGADNYYRRLQSSQLLSYSPVVYHQRLALVGGRYVFLHVEGARAYLSTAGHTSLYHHNQTTPAGGVEVLAHQLGPQQSIHINGVRQNLMSRPDLKVMSVYPQGNNLGQLLANSIQNLNPDQASNRLLLRDATDSIWIGCAGQVCARLKNFTSRNGYIRLALQSSTDSPTGVGHRPGSTMVWNKHYPPPRFLIRSLKQIYSRPNQYVSRGFGEHPEWFIYGRIATARSGLNQDIRDR